MSSGMERILGMLGLARRAGRVIIGADMVCQALPKGTPRLVIVSSHASTATRERLTSKCTFYGIDRIEIDIATDKLGHILGKTTTPAVVAVTDTGFAEEIMKAYRALQEQ